MKTSTKYAKDISWFYEHQTPVYNSLHTVLGSCESLALTGRM